MEILNRVVNVKNRGIGEVGYTLPDTGVRRTWTPGEIKKNMTVAELEQATYIPGGLKLMQKYLLINDQEVCEYLGLETEPEYFYGEEEVRTLLGHGTLDQLLDCLDFAPTGVIDLIKKIAVETKLNNVRKREAIKEKIGFDVSAAILNVEYANTQETEGTATTTRTRRAKPVGDSDTKEEATGRRSKPVETPKYIRAK